MRRSVASLNYICMDRPDVVFDGKECSRGMSWPATGDCKGAKRFACSLRDIRSIEQPILTDKPNEVLLDVFATVS